MMLLVFMVIMIFFLKTEILNPLQEINQSLLLFQQTGSGRISVRRPHLFKEIGKIFANIENVFTQLHKKIIETNEAKEYLEKLMQTAQAVVIKFDKGMR
ncbi:MAG: hypothetical protein MUP19_05090, partial [Candidatus Aminicenantes bacterium]|nr:hypothetical protein [Candidatus Aminicenantes bacterium]